MLRTSKTDKEQKIELGGPITGGTSNKLIRLIRDKLENVVAMRQTKGFI